jgi:hypothetical protein
MADQPVPTINGNRYSWASVEIDVGGVIVTDIVSIDYGTKIDRKEIYGTGTMAAVGRTRGRGSHTASFEIRKEAFRNMIKRMGAGFMEVNFNITINYQDEGNPICTDKLMACEMGEVGNSAKDGPDDLIVKVPLSVLRVEYDGLSPFKDGKLN